MQSRFRTVGLADGYVVGAEADDTAVKRRTVQQGKSYFVAGLLPGEEVVGFKFVHAFGQPGPHAAGVWGPLHF